MRVTNLLKTRQLYLRSFGDSFLSSAKKYKGTSGGSHQFSLTHYSETYADQGNGARQLSQFRK